MANVIIKSEERERHEAFVRNSYGVSENDTAGRDACEVIAAKTREAVDYAKEIGGRKSWS
jgi:hypothetical protein